MHPSVPCKGFRPGHTSAMTQIVAHRGLLRDTRLHIDDTGGAGRPVVLIHGWPLTGESWSAQVPVLRDAGYRVVTYDRRGFGRSDKPLTGYSFDTLAEDLHAVLDSLDLRDVTLVGFSMGGGEVARYLGDYGRLRLRGVVFAASVTPYLMRTPGNPEGPLRPGRAAKLTAALTVDRDRFHDRFVEEFFSVDGTVVATREQRRAALAQCRQAGRIPALECLAAFVTADFRDDLVRAAHVPTLVLHGDADATVPFGGSGARTHAAVPGSRLVILRGAPHGCNVTHAEAFNRALLDFLAAT
ncbi:alpha/beta hydrolase [Virgisporangium ochraceum]